MSDSENARAQADALHEAEGAGATTRALRSARRAQLWAGFNRYLQSEAALASKASKDEAQGHRDKDEHEPDGERQETP